MVLLQITESLLTLWHKITLSYLTVGEIPFRQKYKVKQLKVEIDQFLEETDSLFGEYYQLLEFYKALIVQNMSQEECDTFENQIILVPIQKYLSIKQLKTSLKILDWHIQYVEGKSRQDPKLNLSSSKIPKKCKLSQIQLLEFIEETKVLFFQSKSIMNYKVDDIANINNLLMKKYSSKIESFVEKKLTDQEREAYNFLNIISQRSKVMRWTPLHAGEERTRVNSRVSNEYLSNKYSPTFMHQAYQDSNFDFNEHESTLNQDVELDQESQQDGETSVVIMTDNIEEYTDMEDQMIQQVVQEYRSTKNKQFIMSELENPLLENSSPVNRHPLH